MNKILVLGIQNRKNYLNIRCYFTFDKLLINSSGILELLDYIVPVEVLPLQAYKKWKDYEQVIDIFDDKYFHFNNSEVVWNLPPEYAEFLDSHQTLYKHNDFQCLKYKDSFKNKSYTINKFVNDQGIYMFDQTVFKNPITLGAFEYLSDLKLVDENKADIKWLHLVIDSLKTLLLFIN